MDSAAISLEGLDEVTVRKIKNSLGENPESRLICLQSLKIKLSSIEDLKFRSDDDFLLRFLRIAKFDVNKAYDRVRKYYQSRKKYPDIFSRLFPSETLSAQTARHFHASPIRTEDGSLIVYLRRGLYDPQTMDFEEMFILDLLCLEYLVMYPVVQLYGVTVIVDFKNYGIKHIFQDSPKRLRMAVDSFQNTFPLRFKSIHIVNAPSLFSMVYTICYPFLTRKTTDRLHVHSKNDDWKGLHSLISPEVLSEEYGGKIPKEKLIDIVEEVSHLEEFFQQQLQFGYVK